VTRKANVKGRGGGKSKGKGGRWIDVKNDLLTHELIKL